MNMLWRYVWRKMRQVGNEVQEDCTVQPKMTLGSDIDSDEGINITVRTAIGGRIVSFRHYDRQRDRSVWKNYVIPDELDFERELGKIITLESMRR